MKRTDRQEREKEYIDVNNTKESVCKGFFYVKNKKSEEPCKHCKECGKCQAYKKDIDKQVKFHYVDSFRECELYKKFPLKKKDTRDFDAVWKKIQANNPMMLATPIALNNMLQRSNNVKVISVPIGGQELKARAYEKMVHDHSELMAYITWSQLLAIEVMSRSHKMLNDVIRESALYYGDIEDSYRQMNYRFSKYIENVHKKCYIGDEQVVIDFSKKFDDDIIKMRLSIENFLSKWSEEVFLTEELALIITFQTIVDLVNVRMEDNNKYIGKYNKNVKFDKFISTEPLKESISSLILAISNFMGIHSKIDMNQCKEMVDSLIVIDKKIGDYETFQKLLKKVYAFNGSKRRIKRR